MYDRSMTGSKMTKFKLSSKIYVHEGTIFLRDVKK